MHARYSYAAQVYCAAVLYTVHTHNYTVYILL